MAILIRRLRLKGLTKDYDVSFMDRDVVRPLSIIAGEISTGKTSVLEFIDYCLGADYHPRYAEIQRQVRSALLEIGLNGEVIVIERGLFSPDLEAFVHECTIDELELPHAKTRKRLRPAGSEDSLSSFLLEHCGLLGISLKEAPTQESSKTDPLSFRDVMWVSFLSNSRLDSKQLLHEPNFMKALKLRQVIEVIFEIHDDILAKLGDSLSKTEQEKRTANAELESLRLFLEEQQIADKMSLVGDLEEITAESTAMDRALATLSETMRAETAYAEDLRREYSTKAEESSRWAAIVRDRKTLLHRLLPLRGQYAEDEKKLVFFDEAKQLFDPLRVNYCPCCLQGLDAPASIENGKCSLCGKALRKQDDQVLDVKAELRITRLRKREIDKYIEEVDEELKEAVRQLKVAKESEITAQSQLDSGVARTLSPYVAQRDGFLRKKEALRSDRRDRERQIGWHDSLEKRRARIQELEDKARRLRSELEEKEKNRTSREEVVAELSTRFENILKDFGYPKLYDPEAPFLDKNFIPHVRGDVYRTVGSSGALTLISLAWALAMFELATELGHPHPGFLMIDSPQKNLTPVGKEPEVDADEFQDPAIAQKVWTHLQEWSLQWASSAQLVVVDNLPPESAAGSIVVRYSGRPGEEPYGLIEDETPE